MEFRNLEYCDFETVFQGFERAFADYEIRFEKEEVRAMLQRRGYNPKLSFAFFENGYIVAFSLNGIDAFNCLPTAYDTGTGTAKDYRGMGLAGEIFSRSIPFLKEAGIRQYLLEVLTGNHKAIAVYRKLGFETVRELDCFRQTLTNISLPTAAGGESTCTIAPIGIESVEGLQCCCDFTPSWQNSIDSIKRGRTDLTMIGAFIEGMSVGYCVFDRNTGDLTQIAVKQEYRRQGVASQLLCEVIRQMCTDFVKVINVPSDNLSLPAFLKSKNIPLMNKQFEMVKDLT